VALGFQLGTADPDVFPGVGLHPDLVPQILSIEAGETDVVGREGAPGFVALVVGNLPADGEDLTVFLFGLSDEPGKVAHMFLVQVRTAVAVERENVVSRLGGNLRRGASRQLQMRDVIDRDGNAVLLSPLFGEAIEPSVILWDEMTPLQDSER